MKVYRSALLEKYDINNNLSDKTVAGKREFLRFHSKARLAAITKANIRDGWKASGTWPVNV